MMPPRLKFYRILLLSLAANTLINRNQAWLIPSGLTAKHGRLCTQLEMSSRKHDKIDEFPQKVPIFGSSTEKSASDIQQRKRKLKTNKYAEFSKVENPNTSHEMVDPFEALIRESEEKLRKLEQDKAEANAKPVITLVTPNADKRLTFPDNRWIDPYDPTTFGYVEIGTVVGPHGVHGWSKVKGCTDFSERLTTPGMLLHFKPFRKRAPRKVILANGKCTGCDSFIVQLQDMYDRRQAEKLKGGTLYYAMQQDHVRKEQDLLLSDLVGLQVLLINDDETEGSSEHVVGTVGAIVLAEEMCAIPGLGQDMLEVIIARQNGDAFKRGNPNSLVLIPMVPEICKKVDLKDQRIWIDPPAGLLDLTYIREEKVRIKALLPPAKD